MCVQVVPSAGESGDHSRQSDSSTGESGDFTLRVELDRPLNFDLRHKS